MRHSLEYSRLDLLVCYPFFLLLFSENIVQGDRFRTKFFFLKVWWHDATLFVYFCILRYTHIHLITFILYIYPSPFTEVYLHIFIAGQLSGKTSLWFELNLYWLGFSGRICSHWQGFSDSICSYWPGFSVTCSYWPRDFPAISVVTCRDFLILTFPARGNVKSLPPETRRPGFSGRICSFWPGISGLGMENLYKKNVMGHKQIVLVSSTAEFSDGKLKRKSFFHSVWNAGHAIIFFKTSKIWVIEEKARNPTNNHLCSCPLLGCFFPLKCMMTLV